ncbi:MAG TPA: GNAT family N-acetyltransferase [Nitrospirota bacterium]|nr:GNAT family N-acetyltransferase [Nitrospirota bacterium]
MVGNSIKVRQYRSGDEKGINELFGRLFHKSRTPGEWEWKFRNNPHSRKPADWITVAERDDCIVGHYASLPVEMKYKDSVVLASQPVDTMIDLSAKGATLLKLVKMHQQNKRDADAFTFGFPNEMAYEVGKLVLGYQDLGEMVQYFKRLSLRSAIKRRFPYCPYLLTTIIHRVSQALYGMALSLSAIKSGVSRTLIIEEGDTFDSKVNRLWEAVRNRFGIAVIRRDAYLNWRYKKRGYIILLCKEGEDLSGYAVLKITGQPGTRVGYIMDLLSKEEVTAPLLIRVLRIFVERDVDFALCGLMKGDSMERDIGKVGYRRHNEFKHIPVVCVPLSTDIEKDYLMRPENWHFTYGDIDGM